MTNDDPDYVRHLERALEAAELEIKGLENELREQDEALRQMQEQLAPVRMGEPYIEELTAEQAFNILWPNQDLAPFEPCEAFAAGYNFRRASC
jgi:hypothetical protein